MLPPRWIYHLVTQLPTHTRPIGKPFFGRTAVYALAQGVFFGIRLLRQALLCRMWAYPCARHPGYLYGVVEVGSICLLPAVPTCQ